MTKLPLSFYNRKDVLSIARELLGKIIITRFDDNITSGRIVETEAYVGLADKASHAFAGKRTSRNEHMYASPATAYVYICYGMHRMFNIVTNEKEIPDADHCINSRDHCRISCRGFCHTCFFTQND